MLGGVGKDGQPASPLPLGSEMFPFAQKARLDPNPNPNPNPNPHSHPHPHPHPHPIPNPNPNPNP